MFWSTAIVAALAAAAIQGQGPAPAAGSGPTMNLGFSADQPIDLSAERCEVYDNRDTVNCNGTVRVTQGEALLTADEMTVFGTDTESGFERIEAEGGVRYASGPNALSGQRGVYTAADTTLVVTGDVVVIQDGQVMTGGRLVYNTETGSTSFTPTEGGRVRGIFYTAQKEAP